MWDSSIILLPQAILVGRIVHGRGATGKGNRWEGSCWCREGETLCQAWPVAVELLQCQDGWGGRRGWPGRLGSRVREATLGRDARVAEGVAGRAARWCSCMHKHMNPFACLISRIFCQLVVFLSYNKLANITFRHRFSDKREGEKFARWSRKPKQIGVEGGKVGVNKRRGCSRGFVGAFFLSYYLNPE